MKKHHSLFSLSVISIVCLIGSLVLTPHLFSQTPPVVIAGPITNLANGHHYYLLSTNSWTASQAKALTLGGHLVTINDAAENSWVYSTFGTYGGVDRSLWIGLNDQAQEGTFVWASGQTTSYSNWRGGEPSNSAPSENYVHLCPPNFTPGQWNDLANFSTFFNTLNGVVEIVPSTPSEPSCSTLLAAANATNELLRAQITLLNNSNAVLRTQVSLLNNSNAVLRSRISILEFTNSTLRAQLTNANNTIVTLHAQLGAATNTIATLQENLAAAHAANAALQAQLDAANAENQQLQAQVSAIAQSVTLLEDFFAEELNTPTFVIPGGTTELQVSNLVSAIQTLNPGQQRALMNILLGAKRRTLR